MSTIQGAVAELFGWEGNRRSEVAPAVRHRLRGISTYKLHGFTKGDENPQRSCRNTAPFTFFTPSITPFRYDFLTRIAYKNPNFAQNILFLK